MFTIEFDATCEKLSGTCQCCGNQSMTVWGYGYTKGNPCAVYYVQWTPGHEQVGAMFDIVVGDWSENSGPQNRMIGFLEFYKGKGFRAVDATPKTAASTGLANTFLIREQFLSLPFKESLFAFLDHVYLHDDRLKELRD